METLTDIVFEKRNKAYGAYVLRREYRNVLLISLLLGIFLLASAFAYPIIASYQSKNQQVHEKIDITVTVDNGIKPDLPTPPPVEPALPELKFKFVPPKVVDEDVESGMQTQGDLANIKTDELPAISAGNEIVPATEPVQVIPSPVQDVPQVAVQEMPAFTGGESELYKFLSANLRYPAEAKELGVQGKVYVEFVVERDGSISNVNIKRGIGAGCDEEAARVVSSMPKWNAGKQNGQPVRVLFVLPIKFILN